MQKSNLALFLSNVLYITDRTFPVFSSSCNNRAEKEDVSYITSKQKSSKKKINLKEPYLTSKEIFLQVVSLRISNFMHW